MGRQCQQLADHLTLLPTEGHTLLLENVDDIQFAKLFNDCSMFPGLTDVLGRLVVSSHLRRGEQESIIDVTTRWVPVPILLCFTLCSLFRPALRIS